MLSSISMAEGRRAPQGEAGIAAKACGRWRVMDMNPQLSSRLQNRNPTPSCDASKRKAALKWDSGPTGLAYGPS